ncbi:VOC family protein [Cecembia calidifontis]|uniref:Catechol 2,3-dioxygenase-like lactoylglutathione lyase family enzyme n=1 Tax=Cecembia calidifontis TaxID=1187080 RepID=A0A4Q7PEE3_9BACT|nr:VOC family protein [Cecembia calidifontis]RZS98784.1 catechol 2,3-dioxygenase-like lactoylglutathione lyase family enzyme [Cecembia calidifontis]
MKKMFFILAGIIYLSVMSHTVIAQAKITHIAVYVKDLKRSADFYSNVFRFPELDEPFKDGLHAWFDIGNNLSLHVIQAPWEPITINKNNHICFSVPDMEKFITNLNDLGVEFEDWPGNKGKVNIRPDGIKQIYIRDPDGYWIEINDEF